MFEKSKKFLWDLYIWEKFSDILFKYYFNFKMLIVKKNRISISVSILIPTDRILYTYVHGVGELVTQANSVWGWLGNRQYYMSVCQYPGRCYHSEACMAGVGNDVMYLV